MTAFHPVSLYEVTRRTRHAHAPDWSQVCPVCNVPVNVCGAHLHDAKRRGENVSPTSRIFCSAKCKQKAYRIRGARKRNA